MKRRVEVETNEGGVKPQGIRADEGMYARGWFCMQLRSPFCMKACIQETPLFSISEPVRCGSTYFVM